MQTHPPIPGYAFPTRLESPHRFLAAGSGWCFSNQSWVCSCSFDFLACIKAQSPFGLAFTWSTGRGCSSGKWVMRRGERAEERSEGKGCVSTFRDGWSAYDKTKKKTTG